MCTVCVRSQSLFERQGLALRGPIHPALEKAHIQLPKGMSRTKSFGNHSFFYGFLHIFVQFPHFDPFYNNVEAFVSLLLYLLYIINELL